MSDILLERGIKSPYLFSLISKRFQHNQPPAFEPFVVEDMPHMHRVVYDMYQEIVAAMNAQQQVQYTVHYFLKKRAMNEQTWKRPTTLLVATLLSRKLKKLGFFPLIVQLTAIKSHPTATCWSGRGTARRNGPIRARENRRADGK